MARRFPWARVFTRFPCVLDYSWSTIRNFYSLPHQRYHNYYRLQQHFSILCGENYLTFVINKQNRAVESSGRSNFEWSRYKCYHLRASRSQGRTIEKLGVGHDSTALGERERWVISVCLYILQATSTGYYQHLLQSRYPLQRRLVLNAAPTLRTPLPAAPRVSQGRFLRRCKTVSRPYQYAWLLQYIIY